MCRHFSNKPDTISSASVRMIADWLIVEWARGNRSHHVRQAFDHAQALAREDSDTLATFIQSEVRRPEDAPRPGDRPTTLTPPTSVVGHQSTTATKES